MGNILQVSLLVGAAVGLALIIYQGRRIHVLELTRRRLAESQAATPNDRSPPPRARPFFRHHYLVPWLMAVLVVGCLYFLTNCPVIFALTFGLVTGLLLGQLEAQRVTRIRLRIEEQLA